MILRFEREQRKKIETRIGIIQDLWQTIAEAGFDRNTNKEILSLYKTLYDLLHIILNDLDNTSKEMVKDLLIGGSCP